ncbi:MAG: hypothetical protein U9Q92_07135 [archaeon]|nr:hypothetical protein [archaeon]
MDKRGTGFLRIREAMKKWNLPVPQFEEKTGYFRIRFTNPVMQNIPVIEARGLNDRQRRAVAYLRTNKLAPRDYRKLFDVSDKTARSDLKEMEKKGYVTFVGSKKTGYYVLKLPNKLPNKNEED